MSFTPIAVSRYGRLTPRFDAAVNRWRDQRTGRFSPPGMTMEQVCTVPIADLISAYSVAQDREN